MEELYRKANEYQLKIADPSKKSSYLSKIVEEQNLRTGREVPRRCDHDTEEFPEEESPTINRSN